MWARASSSFRTLSASASARISSLTCLSPMKGSSMTAIRSYSRNYALSASANTSSTEADVATVTITFVEENLEDGDRITVQAPLGAKLVDVALDNDVDIEAACGGELACSTCHCIFTDQCLYEALPSKQEEEEDMLDLAVGLTETSRLSCQLEVTSLYEGAIIIVPGEGL